MSIPKPHQPSQQPPPQRSPEDIAKALDGFRKSLEDVRDVTIALGPYCSTPDELLSMVELGIQNDGQLRLLLSEVTNASPGEE